jgi:hypothetical protein
VYYTQYGYYPRQADLNSASWLATNMKSLDAEALKDPSGTSKRLAAAPASGVYSYSATNSSNKSCENDKTTCQKFTLTATYEGNVNGKATLVVNNLDGA